MTLSLFIVGVPRSGTTLLQRLLAQHRSVTTFTESHFFSRHYRALPRTAVLMRDPRDRVREFLSENEFAAEADDLVAQRFRGGRSLPGLWLRSRRFARAFLELLDELASRRECPVWLEKTPRHLRFAPFLRRLEGGRRRTRFIHIVRHGLSAAASLHRASRHWERQYSLAECADRWNADVRFSQRCLGQPGHSFVTYERLTSDPDRELARLLAESGLEPQDGLAADASRAPSAFATAAEHWKHRSDGAIRAKADVQLDEAQRHELERTLDPQLYEAMQHAIDHGGSHER